MISIVIIVKNDRRIGNLLENLKQFSSLKRVEVIVVDASNGTLDDIKLENSFVRWEYYNNKTNKRTTIPEQRNEGVKLSRGNIIVFIDSDCIPKKNWLDELINPIENKNEYIVAGKVELSDKNSLHSQEFEKHDLQIYIDEAPTMNIAIKKEVFNKVGLFDINFQCGEDVDFLWRASRKGYKIRYKKNAVIYHDLGNFKAELYRMFTYGSARTRLYKKHTYRWKLFFGNEMLKIIYPLYFIFLPVTIFIKTYPALIVLLLIKNLEGNPLKTLLLKTTYGLGMLKEIVLIAYSFAIKKG